MTFPEGPPPISPRTALLSSLAFTALYVAPFYLSPTLRSTSPAHRDAPSVIRARIRSVTLACAASLLLTAYLLTTHAHATPRDLLRLWGLWPLSLLDTVRLPALVALLFAGPLFKSLLAEGAYRTLTPTTLKAELWTSWTGYRNLIAAPVSEELVFRSLVISLHLAARVPPTRIVFTTPLVFGAAHLHHLAANLRACTPAGSAAPPPGAVLQCVAVSLFQLGYTSAFGFFAAFALLRTGNLPAVVLVHGFCNAMGVPQFWGRVEGGDGEELGVEWTVAYYALLVAGAGGFWALLWAWTESANALVAF